MANETIRMFYEAEYLWANKLPRCSTCCVLYYSTLRINQFSSLQTFMVQSILGLTPCLHVANGIHWRTPFSFSRTVHSFIHFPPSIWVWQVHRFGFNESKGNERHNTYVTKHQGGFASALSPWKSNKYYLCLVSSLTYAACKAHALYYIVICGLSGSKIIFHHYLINGTIFGGGGGGGSYVT
jgi:hypothetical protein